MFPCLKSNDLSIFCPAEEAAEAAGACLSASGLVSDFRVGVGGLGGSEGLRCWGSPFWSKSHTLIGAVVLFI